MDGLGTGRFFLLASPLVGLFLFADSDLYGSQFRPSRITRRGSLATALLFGITIGIFLGIMGWLTVGLSHGFQFGLVSGSVGGLVFGILGGLETPVDIKATVSPTALLSMDRRKAAFQMFTCWLVFELVFVLGAAVGAGYGYGITLGLSGGFVLLSVVGRSVWVRWLVFARCGLPLTGRLPWAVIAFLDDAHRRGVLRQTGAVYQFRHARLQDHLARGYQARRDQQRGPTQPGRSGAGVLSHRSGR